MNSALDQYSDICLNGGLKNKNRTCKFYKKGYEFTDDKYCDHCYFSGNKACCDSQEALDDRQVFELYETQEREEEWYKSYLCEENKNKIRQTGDWDYSDFDWDYEEEDDYWNHEEYDDWDYEKDDYEEDDWDDYEEDDWEILMLEIEQDLLTPTEQDILLVKKSLESKKLS